MRAPASLLERWFTVRRDARQHHGLDAGYFSIRGDVVLATHRSAHQLRAALAPGWGAEPPSAAELYAMGLIHELNHALIDTWRALAPPGAFTAVLAELASAYGPRLDATLLAFVDRFPPPPVYGGQVTAAAWLEGSTAGVANKELALEELVLLWVQRQNPAYAPIRRLISDDDLSDGTVYPGLIEAAGGSFAARGATLGPDQVPLLRLLLSPIEHAPASLEGQLGFMRTRLAPLLERAGVLEKALGGLDLFSEEKLAMWRLTHPAGPAGAAEDLIQDHHAPGVEPEAERFSPDRAWMPRVVMIAKSTFVWLDQLSRRYGRAVSTLADIPDEELETLARRGFTALWLIGIWRRSAASRRIKQLQGNLGALASAYSLADYEIAPELGGEPARSDLERRAARFGIRLASDMVPNHTGLDSRWVVEHPEWFIQSEHPPFPGYTFDGPNLSADPRVGLFLEDGYWRRTDAAVVFKRVDRTTGQVRYIYHGNDGTSMPWNDTAQLDYLRADVREAVIQTILHVARSFPIIRFDAAMTLAKKHYQRLWFPLPGTGGAIPSRADYSLTRERFDALMPAELWREVVDRVAAEAPDTLLLAEAFWLMEGYFVRTLGMHRVYNSAFMNMLKREDNASFRRSVASVLEHDPRILERHVNFMNNPDEEPAIEQFGDGDKYFGVATLLATMPGLPMFGHGQIEGFHEKYGMEFARAAWDEQPKEWLVDRHAREIFPLLRERALFSGVEGFQLFDLVTADAGIDEDVIAFCNRLGEERILVVCHNRYKETRGRLQSAVPRIDGEGRLSRQTLAGGLGLSAAEADGPPRFLVMKDATSGEERLVAVAEVHERGLSLRLGPFEHHVFWRLRELEDRDGRLAALARELGGGSVPSVEDAAAELGLSPILAPYWEAINPGSARWLSGGAGTEDQLLEKARHLLDGLEHLSRRAVPERGGALEVLRHRFRAGLEVLGGRPGEALGGVLPGSVWVTALYTRTLLDVVAGLPVGEEPSPDARGVRGSAAARALRLDRVMGRALRAGGASEEGARDLAELALALLDGEPAPAERARVRVVRALLALPGVRRLLSVHTHAGVVWFNRERWESLILLLGAVWAGGTPEGGAAHGSGAALAWGARLIEAARVGGYRLEVLEAHLAEVTVGGDTGGETGDSGGDGADAGGAAPGASPTEPGVAGAPGPSPAGDAGALPAGGAASASPTRASPGPGPADHAGGPPGDGPGVASRPPAATPGDETDGR